MFRTVTPLVLKVNRQQTSQRFRITQKLALAVLGLVLATVVLWLGPPRVSSAPAGPAVPPLPTPIPEVKLEDVPAEALIGEPFKFKVTFDNVGTVVGYAPFIDVVLPAYGMDNTTSSFPCDGISMPASLDGLMVSVNGGPLPVTTYKHLAAPCSSGGATTITHPYSASGLTPVILPPGAQLVTLELPFGSFEPDQPKIEIELTVDLHNFADVGPPNQLPIYARGGFRFGSNPLNDPTPDPPILTNFGNPATDGGNPSNSLNWVERKDVIPTVFTVAKTYLGPEGEAVSGPNFIGYYPLRYQVTVNIAKGQTVTQLNVKDCLDNNMTFVSLVAPTTPGYTTVFTSPCLQMTYASVFGTVSPADVVITYEFYIPQFLTGTKDYVLDPEACANTTSTNKVKATGKWVPLDPRDGGTTIQVSGSAKYVLEDKHIAIQKSVKVKVPKGTGLIDKADLPIPGDYLEYRLKFQVADYFTFGEIEIDDVISDGQLLIDTAPAAPVTLRVTDRFGTSQGKISTPDVEVTDSDEADCQGVKGGTKLVFKVSQAMMSLSGFAWHNQGIMTGGYAFTPYSPVAAEGEIVFYVQIQDEFSHQGSDKAKKFVDKHDPMNNCVSIHGRIYENSAKQPTPRKNDDAVCSDGSATSLMIKPDVLRKFIIGRNQKLLKKSTNANPPKFAAGDTITFSISKTIPSGDWEKLTVRDWVPLPVLDASTLSLSSTLPACGGTMPIAGHACLGPNDNVGSPLNMGLNPDNSFTLDYDNQNNPANTPKTIEIWFTLTLTNQPYADGLYFTNEAQECEDNTFGVRFCQVAVARFELTEPSLRITKGVVWAGNPNTNTAAVFNPAQAVPSGVAFSGPSAPCPRFAPTINSANLGSTISSDVSGVDAGDIVLYAIVVENLGSGLNGAFDVTIKDTLPSGLTAVSPVCVSHGNGIAIPSTGPLFSGLQLTDSGTQGALAPFDNTSTSTGQNLAVISFYAKIDEKIRAACFPNKAELLSYASAEGGPNFVSAGYGGPFTDVANVCVLPVAKKCVNSTSEPHTQPDNSITLAPPQPPKVAIGEIVRYRLWVAIPEGISSGFFITDSLPPSMTYMNDGTTKVMFRSNSPITSNVPAVANLIGLQSAGSKTTCTGPQTAATLPASQISPATFSAGTAPKFTLGTLTNSDADADVEYVIVEFNALVNNLPINVSALPNKDGVTLTNSYQVFIKGAPTPAATSNNTDVQVVEPKLDVLKTASPASVLPGGVVTFTVKVTNNGSADAFDVQLTDPLPIGSGLSFMPGTASVSSSCSTPTLNAINGNVSIPQMPKGCSVVETFQARETRKCPTDAVTNTAFADYTSLPGVGTPVGISNATGSITPGLSGAGNGERRYKASGSVTVSVICTGSLAVTKIVKNLTNFTPPAISFPINVSCSPSGLNVTLNPLAGATQVVNNIPIGSTCTVTEGALPPPIAHPACASLGWSTTPTYSPAQPVLITTPGATVAVQVENTYMCLRCATPPANMVSWWPLDEPAGSTLIKDIKSGHNGTPTGGSLGAFNSQPGKVAGGLFVTGGFNVSVPDDPALRFGANNFSIDAWFGSSQPQLIGSIVDKLDVNTKKGYAFYVQGNRLKLVLGNGTVFTTYTSVASVGITSAMSWHHVAVTVDRVNALGVFYIDGVPGAPFSILAAGFNISTTSPLLLGGSRQTFTTCACEFMLDEIEIFSQVVSPADIKSIFQADKQGKCRATIKGMKFEDVNGNGVHEITEPGLANWSITAADSSANTQTTLTDSLGNYSFTVPAPGSYTVSEVLQLGWTQTAPGSSTHAVSVAAGQVVSGRDFGNKKKLPACDLVLKKEVKPTPLVNGQLATATITVTNVGSAPCHGPTQVTELPPTGWAPVSASVPGGSCVLSTGVCNYPPAIYAGSSVVFTYVFKVNALPGAAIENCANVKNAEDNNAANNAACVPLKFGNGKELNLSLLKKTR